jgi:NTP pyrophosphatase (non-canonical NTP hydrolase)
MTTLRTGRPTSIAGSEPGGYWDPFQNLARLSEEVSELARAVNQTRDRRRSSPERVGDPASSSGTCCG